MDKMIEEPDPDVLCQYSRLERHSETEAIIIKCEEGPGGSEKLADYRILISSGKKDLVEGGAPRNPKDYKPRFDKTYYCKKHFDEKIRFSKEPMPPFTFRKIKR